MTRYDASNKVKTEELTKIADEQLSTYVYLTNSDQEKYWSLIKELHSQKALKNDQFPKTMIEGNNVLSTHRHDNTKENNKDGRKKDKHEKNKDNDKQEGEKNDESLVLSFAQLEG